MPGLYTGVQYTCQQGGHVARVSRQKYSHEEVLGACYMLQYACTLT